MTDMMISRSPAFPSSPAPAGGRARWWRRGTGATLVAALALAAVLGPPLAPATRLGAGELVGFSTVSAADTITSSDVLAEVPAAGRGRERVGNGLKA
ncbi:hypothetical protein [Actinoplanes sp. ATCC 53533]|uniref:hypothetical protein n=1 Tax=Actinoplanes sp. ATCC 53533 TaxID=1288362 RepID=UPI000F79C1BC|nr:hypothetical protein [Actinoplanes sp. ATCC 53533]